MLLSLPGLLGPFGVGKLRATQSHIIADAVFKQLFRGGRILHGVDGYDRNLYSSLYGRGKILLPALVAVIRLNYSIAGGICTAADIDGNYAETLQIAGYAHALLEVDTALEILVCAYTDTDREIRSASITDADYYLGNEPHTVDEVAAVAVGALVGQRTHELIEQIAVRRMQLDAVHTCHLGHHGGLHEFLAHCLHLGGGHCTRHLTYYGAWNGTGSYYFSGRLHCGGYLASGVMQLEEYLRVIPVHGVCQLFQALHVLGARGVKLIESTGSSLLINTGYLRADKCASRLGALLVVPYDLGRGFTVGTGHARTHGRHNNPAFQLQVANFSPGEQFLVHRHSFLSCWFKRHLDSRSR